MFDWKIINTIIKHVAMKIEILCRINFDKSNNKIAVALGFNHNQKSIQV